MTESDPHDQEGPHHAPVRQASQSGVQFRVLGPLEVAVGSRILPPATQKERVLLAALLLHHGRAVPVSELIRVLWNARVPADPRGSVQKYVMRLRRSLQPTGCVIRTDQDGYRLEIAPEMLDLNRFTALVEVADRTRETGDLARASGQLAAALALWRAVPPLSNVLSDALHRELIPRLLEKYLRTVETRIDLDLELGQHARLCGELLELTVDHPFRERFWAQRMRALAGANRQAEALHAYRTIVRLLAEELGVDPGPELRAVHEQILKGEEHLAREPTPADAPPVWPRQLPMSIGGLVGRQSEIEEIAGALQADPNRGLPRLVLVTGRAGVGKTAVAVAAAHRSSDFFPDGQLFAELRGESERDVDEVLAYLLRSLGLPAASVPSHRMDAVALYRSMTAGRRLLVVLDGADRAASVRALLPGSERSCVLVTSRRPLTDLLVSPGAHQVELALLADDDARELVRSVVGAKGATADPEVIERIVRHCGGSPIALRTAAAHLVTAGILRGPGAEALRKNWNQDGRGSAEARTTICSDGGKMPSSVRQ